MDDAEIKLLVTKAQAGDGESCNKVLLEFHGMMYSIAFRYVSLARDMDADDLVQECYASLLLSKFKAYKADRGPFGGWLYRAIIGRVQNSATKRKWNKDRLSIYNAIPISQLDKDMENDWLSDAQ